MQARLRAWLIAIAVMVLVAAAVITDPFSLDGRTDPRTNRPLRHLAQVWRLYLYPPLPSVRLGLDLQGGSHVVLRARNQALFTYSFGRELAPREEDAGPIQAEVRELLIAQGILDDHDHPIEATYADGELVGAFWNFISVLEDRSYGIHNFAYTQSLLQSSIDYVAQLD